MTAGRPTKFKHEFVGMAEKLARLGATDEDLADFFAVDVATIYRWKNAQPEFCEALKASKASADDQVERSLFQRALGYEHDAVKIAVNAQGEVTQVPYVERYAPDTTAAIFWLKNRQPDKWRDVNRHEHAGKDGAPLIPQLNVTISAAKPEPSSEAG